MKAMNINNCELFISTITPKEAASALELNFENMRIDPYEFVIGSIKGAAEHNLQPDSFLAGIVTGVALALGSEDKRLKMTVEQFYKIMKGQKA